MSILLVCPSNMLYMPYVSNYEDKLKEYKIEYDVINWDRFKIEDDDKRFIYRDKKVGHRRSFIDYIKYSKFIKKHLKNYDYDKIIVFGFQLAYFLKKELINDYNGRYILDVRDYNRILNVYKFDKLINMSMNTIISSEGYKEWLPQSSKYIINHNTQIRSLNEISDDIVIDNLKVIDIAYIGAIRDLDINKELMINLQNANNINVKYHGEGNINKVIDEFIKVNDINNVEMTGRYNRDQENDLYRSTTLINVLRYNDSINNKTALPNRLYKSAILGRPMLALDGTFLSDIIKEYKLGLVVSSFENLENDIHNYLENFNYDEYDKYRKKFLSKVIGENGAFNDLLERL